MKQKPLVPGKPGSARFFETHFEVADRLGITPKAVIAKARRAGSGYGVCGGVYFFPTQTGPDAMRFFERLMEVRYGYLH